MFIFAADLHLSELTFKDCPNARYDSVTSFEEVLKQAADRACPLVLGGDIWDSRHVSSRLLERVLAVRAKYGDTAIYYINGNHDSVEPPWTSFLAGGRPEKLCRLGSRRVTLPDGETLVGLDYCHPEIFKENFDLLEKGTDYIVLHQYIESKASGRVSQSIPMSLFEDAPVILAGDIHQKLDLRYKNARCLYPGPTNRRTVSEPSGSCLLVQDGEFQWIDLPARPLVNISLDSELSACMVPDILEGLPDGAYVVVRGPAFQDTAVQFLRERAGTNYHFLFRKRPEETVEYSVSSAASSNARQYAVSALDSLELDKAVKLLCKEALQYEDAFFEMVNESLS